MYKKAQAHFKKIDQKLYKASLLFDIPDIVSSKNLFEDIIRTIIGQQLSGKAADTIFARLEESILPEKISAEVILSKKDKTLRGCGLSGAKMRAIQNTSREVLAGDIQLERLYTYTDEEIIQKLTKIKGVGPWTAEMILMFSIGRTDIFSMGDLGLKKGLMSLYKLKKPPDAQKITALTEKWSPYRTYGARILWRIADSAKQKIKK